MGVGIMVGLSVGLCFGVGIWFGLLGMGLLAGGASFDVGVTLGFRLFFWAGMRVWVCASAWMRVVSVSLSCEGVCGGEM